MKDSFYATTTSDSNVEVYAVNNQAGGDNLVLINKSQTSSSALAVGLKNVAAGTYSTFQSSPALPYAAPAKVGTGSYTNAVNLTLPAMTVTTIVVQPGTQPAPVSTALYRVVAGGNTVAGYQSPGSLVAGGTTASNPGTTTPPAGIPAQVFKSERWGPQTYTFPVSATTPVAVRLLFAERYPAAQTIGGRRFNIDVNGTRRATNYDIWSQQGQKAGACAVLATKVTPVNGRVTVALTAGAAGSPTINALLLDSTT
jgi:hypothetical protein